MSAPQSSVTSLASSRLSTVPTEDSFAEDSHKAAIIYGIYDVVDYNKYKNSIGFSKHNSLQPNGLGETKTLDRICLKGFNYEDTNKIINMSLTKINEKGPRADDENDEYLFSIRIIRFNEYVSLYPSGYDQSDMEKSYLKNCKYFRDAFYNFLKDVDTNYVTIYVTDLDNITFLKVTDIKKLFNKKRIDLAFISFIGNAINNDIQWRNQDDSTDEYNLESLKYDKIILTCENNFPEFTSLGNSTEPVELNKYVFSKRAMFCLKFLNFITFTTDLFFNLYPYYEDDSQVVQEGGNKVVTKKRKNKLPKK